MLCYVLVDCHSSPRFCLIGLSWRWCVLLLSCYFVLCFGMLSVSCLSLLPSLLTPLARVERSGHRVCLSYYIVCYYQCYIYIYILIYSFIHSYIYKARSGRKAGRRACPGRAPRRRPGRRHTQSPYYDLYICICVYVYIYIYTYMYTYIHIYLYIHIFVYIYIHIYMYKLIPAKICWLEISGEIPLCCHSFVPCLGAAQEAHRRRVRAGLYRESIEVRESRRADLGNIQKQSVF